MKTSPTTIGFPGQGGETPQAGPPPAHDRAPSAIAYLRDPESGAVVRSAFAELGFIDGHVERGGIDTAIAELPQRSWPHFLIIDISGIDDPLPRINQLAEICDPKTEVIAIGDRNDIVLYRDLQAAGVAEYFYKPLLGDLLSRAITEIGSGARDLHPARTGKLIFVVGVRGGVGATTIATNLAWHLTEARQCRVLLIDLDLYSGDAALQLGVQPGKALREALDNPARVDELFIERGVISVSNRLGLLAGLEPLSQPAAISEDGALEVLQKLVPHFRYVVVDMPPEIALSCPTLLRMPLALVLVGDASLTSVRETGRWREALRTNAPERTLLHVLNKKGADGGLPDEEMLRVIPAADVSVRWDRDIMKAAALGTKAVQECSAMHEAMAALSQRLSGTAAEPARPFWKRVFR